MARYAVLPNRGLLALAGADARGFLQGIVTNDVGPLAADRAIHAALLTPQGKYLFDFLLAELDGRLLLESEAARLAELARRLSLYRLRAKVAIEDVSAGLAAVAVFGQGSAALLGLPEAPGAARPFAGGVAFVDPRLPALGVRLLLPPAELPALERAGLAAASAEDYDRHRLELGVPDGSRDLEVDRTILLEANFEELHGVDFRKGCYVGQEVTARTKYRGLVRKRLLPVAVDGPLPAVGTPVLQDGREVGTLRSGRDGLALALLRLDRIAAADAPPLVAGEARLTPRTPDWLVLPGPPDPLETG